MDKDSALFPSIPVNTIRAARALYGRGNVYLRLGDRLNHLVSKLEPGITSFYLEDDKAVFFAVLTTIQYAEKLTDDKLAESIQRRMDLRYALHLDTPSPILDPHSLCMFRSRILTDSQYHGLFEEVFKQIFPEITSTAMSEEPNMDEVIESICENAVRAALMDAMLCSVEALSANHFNWLRGIALPHWYHRYNRSSTVATLDGSVRKQELTQEEIQADIQYLLYEIHESNSFEIMEMPETKHINFIWEQLINSKSMKNCNHCIKMVH